MFLVYKLTRSDNKVYIGTTSEDRFDIRMKDHASSKRFKGYLFTPEILFLSENYDDVMAAETLYISIFNTFKNGLNLTWSGKGATHDDYKFTTLGRKMSPETRAKISAKAKGRRAWNKEIPNYEAKERMKTNNPMQNPEVAERVAIKNRGRLAWNKGIKTGKPAPNRVSASFNWKCRYCQKEEVRIDIVANHSLTCGKSCAASLNNRLRWQDPDYRIKAGKAIAQGWIKGRHTRQMHN